MACNCSTVKTIRISSVTSTSTGVILIPSSTILASSLVNGYKYYLILPCNLTATGVLPIYIQTAIGNIPVLCKTTGNSVFSDQIRKTFRYTVIYGNNNSYMTEGQFVIQNCLCSTNG